MTNWTTGQKAAIDARNPMVLVSAAAGSGKTAVLVERVVALLHEGIDIDKMLICTFTRAAAGEMRERIQRRLDDYPELRKQAFRVSRAHISTLHVFCHDVLRDYFQFAGVDPMAKIGDKSQLDDLFTDALGVAMEEMYMQPSAAQEKLLDRYTDDEIESMARALYPFLMGQPDPFGWMRAHTEQVTPETLSDTSWLRLLDQMGEELLRACAKMLDGFDPDTLDTYEPTLEDDKRIIGLLSEDAKNHRLSGQTPQFSRLSSKKSSGNAEARERFKAVRDQVKKKAKEACALQVADMDTESAHINETMQEMRGLCDMLESAHEKYSAAKAKRNLLSYDDLEHKALKALENEMVRADVAKRFQAVFVDEYQDISPIQEAILSRIHRENMMFMVGDVKQSIYRFRQADPTLFLRKYETYAQDAAADERKIILQHNFRSRTNALRAVNAVFAHAMRKSVTEIEYDKEAELTAGIETTDDPAVELHLITKPDEETENDVDSAELQYWYQYEAIEAANIINRLVGQAEIEVKGVKRTLQYRDCVILLRKAVGQADTIAKILSDAGIPAYSDAGTQYFDLPEVMDVLNILKALDNPLRDLPFISALHCPCFSFSAEDLTKIRMKNHNGQIPFYQRVTEYAAEKDALGKKCARALARMEEWRERSMLLAVDEFLWQLLDESGIYLRAGALKGGEMRQANLRILCERAQSADPLRGLSGFLKQVELARLGNDSESAKLLGEDENVVRIMTLHKSKGLEFPVVLMMGMAANFLQHREGAKCVFHQSCGVAVNYIDPVKRTTCDTAAVRAIKEMRTRDARSEEARLLYVGMTRARDRLFLLGSPKMTNSVIARWAEGDTEENAGGASSMLDWVAEVLHEGIDKGTDTRVYASNGAIFDVRRHQTSDYKIKRQDEKTGGLLPDLTGEIDEKIIKRMTRVPDAGKLPMKTSVSALEKRLRTEADTPETPDTKRRDKTRALPDRPRYMMEETELTGAERGSVTHRVLGRLLLAPLRDASDIGAELLRQTAEMAQKGILTQKERAALDMSLLARFYDSPIGKRLLASPEVHREWPFNLQSGGNLIQGVLDLCFMENGAWVLVDYKTDRCTLSELRERYAGQLSWYARALREITARPVSEALLFSLRLCQTISISAGSAP